MQNAVVPYPTLIVAIFSLIIWLYLLIARGLFWHLRPFDDDQTTPAHLPTWPKVIAVIPARNEADMIAQTVAALVEQDYPGEFSIVVVDDHSEDNTPQIAQQAANGRATGPRLHVLPAPPLPAGWTGKLWALNQGVCISEKSSHSGNPSHSHNSLGPHKSSPQTQTLSSRAEREICFSSSASDETYGSDPTPREGADLSVPNTEASEGASAPEPTPTYFWFTDADIRHAPDTLRRLVVRAQRDRLDLCSLMVLLRAETFPERALIPAFLFFFLKLYPPGWTAAPQSRTAGAAGGCILLRRDALERIGGFAAIRSEVIDDCALAGAVKHSGGKIWMGLTRSSLSQRAYFTFAEIRDMIARTAFTQLRYSTTLLHGTLLGMLLTYVAPITLLFAHDHETRAIALFTWLLMSSLFLPTVRFYRLSPVWAPLLPLASMFYAYATWLSAARYWLNRGAQWKGRSQAPYQA